MTLTQLREETNQPATAVSRRSAPSGKITAVLRVAWLSLWGGCFLLLTSSCIVADPPEYQEPVQTRPVLDVYKADPMTSQVLVVYSNDQVPFSVPVRSEDAGEDLSAHFFIDYSTPTRVLVNSQSVAASTYADDGRVISLKWTVNVSTAGCHVLSLVVAHLSSFERNPSDVLLPGKATTDAAIVSWWLNVNPTPDTPTSTLVNCPSTGIATATGVPTQ